ncbi:MAG: hypothetical protein MHM6MM_002528 [Cercozoa sp. M6MM]
MSADLRDRQQRHLWQMLQGDTKGSSSDINAAMDQAQQRQQQWKCLVYCARGREVLTQLFPVQALRSAGVTLHLSIAQSPRQQMRSVPAVYFVEPSAENIDLMAQDIAAHRFKSFRIEFLSPVARESLQHLARQLCRPLPDSAALAATLVETVRERNSSFVSLAPSLFSLESTDFFLRAHSSADAEVEWLLQETAQRLRGAVALWSPRCTPVLRCPSKSCAASAVAERLAALLTPSDADATVARPVIVLLDRGDDLASVLHHPCRYRALCHDLLDLRCNRVHVSADAEGDHGPSDGAGGGATGGAKRRVLEFNQEDAFWWRHADDAFPEVAEAFSALLQQHQDDATSIQHEQQGELSSLLSELPEWRKRKAQIDRHSAVADAISRQLNQRDLAALYNTERDFLTGHISTSQQISARKQDLLSLVGVGSEHVDHAVFQDRLRFFLVVLLCTAMRKVDASELLRDMEESLQRQADALAKSQPRSLASMLSRNESVKPAVSLAAAAFVRRWLTVHMATALSTGALPESDRQQEEANDRSRLLSGTGLKLLGKFADRVVGTGAELLGQMKQLLPSHARLPLTRALAAALTTGEEQAYCTLDPLGTGFSGAAGPVMCVVVGGLSFAEAADLREYAQRSSARSAASVGVAAGGTACDLVVGATDFPSPSHFLRQITQLAESQP